MELLRTLTLIWSGVLVLALAASLTAIWLYLRRIASALADVREALAGVTRATAPMKEHIQPLREQVEVAHEALQDACSTFEHADEALEGIVMHAGAGEPAG